MTITERIENALQRHNNDSGKVIAIGLNGEDYKELNKTNPPELDGIVTIYKQVPVIQSVTSGLIIEKRVCGFEAL